jgi:hypothetical protein
VKSNFLPDIEFGHKDMTIDSDGVYRLSNSEVQTFKRCKRKWWLQYFRGLKPKHELPIGVKYTGLRYHKALASYYVPPEQNPIDPRETMEQEIQSNWENVKQFCEDKEYGEVPAHIEKDFTSNAELDRAMVKGYMYWLEESGADEYLEIISSETYKSVPMYSHRDSVLLVELIGKIDTIVRNQISGLIQFLDHKTTDSFTRFLNTSHMNEQLLHYSLIQYIDDPESAAHGAIYNLARRVKRKVTAKPPFYDRKEVRFNEHQLEAYWQKLQGVISDIHITRKILGENHRLVVYPTPRTDCAWDCPFFQVCPMFDDGSRAEDYLDEHFTASDPLERYNNESTEG